MTGARIEVKLDDAPVQAVLRQLRTLAGDLTPLYQEIGDQVVTNTLLRFVSGKGPGGVPWKKSYRAEHFGGTTLVKSSILRTSINRRADAGGVTVGTNIKYAAIHQFGGTIVPKNAKALFFMLPGTGANAGVMFGITAQRVVMPARPYLGIDADGRAGILAIATDHLHAASDGVAT